MAGALALGNHDSGAAAAAASDSPTPGLTFGAGNQVAVTKARAYNHAVILRLRVPF